MEKRDTFDLTRALNEHTQSSNTQRAYYRWIERYFITYADWKPLSGAPRLKRMSQIKPHLLQRHLRERKLRDWLEGLLQQGHSRQSLDQARAAVVTLAELAQHQGFLSSELAQELKKVSVPRIKHKQTPERILSAEELNSLQQAALRAASSDNQRIRNQVVMTMLCSMPLRREELASARWSDLAVQDKRIILRLEDGTVDVPRPVVTLLDRWRRALTEGGQEPMPPSPLIRRIWKGGRIARGGVSPDGIWLIVRDCAIVAGLGHVTPDDLRRSVAVQWVNQGMTLEELSRVLRHRSVIITHKFLARLGGAVRLPEAEAAPPQPPQESDDAP